MTFNRHTKAVLATTLFEVGAIKFGEFKLKLHETHPDAPLSPIYLNLRTLENPKPGPLTPEVVQLIGAELFEIADLNCLHYDHVLGIPNAGDPLAEAFAHCAPVCWPVSLLKMTKETGGDKRHIGEIASGVYEADEKVLLIDDLITGADSKLEAIDRVEQAGLTVSNVLVLVDRQQGGASQLTNMGYSVYAVFEMAELLTTYVAKGFITQEKSDEVTTYVHANRYDG
ncbi:MAG TPA: hypothetical protein VMQ44_03125 [Candidatus Saccharimonadales bacterium]|nr:hypothetical protein [Candidatus Saccharimonadales bacterium]